MSGDGDQLASQSGARGRGVWFRGVGQRACAVTAFCLGADRTRTSPVAAGTDRDRSASGPCPFVSLLLRSFDGSVNIHGIMFLVVSRNPKNVSPMPSST